MILKSIIYLLSLFTMIFVNDTCDGDADADTGDSDVVLFFAPDSEALESNRMQYIRMQSNQSQSHQIEPNPIA